MSNLHRYDTYKRNATQVYLGEYASWGNKLSNALTEAAYLISLEKNGDVVKMASYAPLLAKKGFTQWKTDMIYFDNVKICPSVNYYVQKMFSTNQGDLYFDKVIAQETKDTTLAASCVKNSSTGDIILKLVNLGKEPRTMKINLSGFKNMRPDAERIVLKGDADAENTFENSASVVPQLSAYKVTPKFEYSVPAMSLTVLRIKILKD
jgi:alpha-L-arabinofuranosidase